MTTTDPYNFGNCIRDRPFNLKRGGLWFFVSFRNFFFPTTQELEYYFFYRAKCEIFFQHLTLSYMTKTLNQIFLFFLHQNQNIFFSIGNQNIFLEKNHIPPPFKLYCCSKTYLLVIMVYSREQITHTFNISVLKHISC
jgi:hypothetical protein